jgi:hypothetical protein
MTTRSFTFQLLLVFLLITQITLADGLDVESWKQYNAPTFSMAFPGPVEVQKSARGNTYSGQARPSDDLGVQIVVHNLTNEKDATDLDPQDALALFTGDVQGKITAKRVVKGANGFVLVYSYVNQEEGMVVVKLHNVHFLGKQIYDLSYMVVAAQGIDKTIFEKAIENGSSAMRKFRPG